MSIAEILSAAKSLSQHERRQLAKSLLDELADEELKTWFPPGQVYEIYTPEFVPGAESELAKVLEQYKADHLPCRQEEGSA